MPATKPLTLNHNASRSLLIALGLGALAVGLYLGFVMHAESLVVLGTLGVSTVLFAIPLVLISRQFSHPATATLPAAVRAEPSAAAKVQSKPADLPASITPKATPLLPPVPPATVGPAPMPVVALSGKPDRHADFMELMNTTVGDLLLAAQLKDPEAAGRIVTEAILQARLANSAPQPPV